MVDATWDIRFLASMNGRVTLAAYTADFDWHGRRARLTRDELSPDLEPFAREIVELFPAMTHSFQPKGEGFVPRPRFEWLDETETAEPSP